MKEYFNISWDFNEEKYRIGEMIRLSDDSDLEEYIDNLWKGVKLPVKEFLIELDETDHITPDLLYMASHLIMSEKLRKVINVYENNLQWTSVRFVNFKNILPYWHCNILNNIDVFDWEHSVYKASTFYKDNTIMEWDNSEFILSNLEELCVLERVDHLSLVSEEIKSRHLFQIKYLETYKFVSRELKEAIEAAGITGVKFIPLSEFTSGF